VGEGNCRVDKRPWRRYTVSGTDSAAATHRPRKETMPNSNRSDNAKPLSLALSGGGVKCAAQAGVLSVLEAAGLPVGAIAGASGGGMVGILYGLGYSPRTIAESFAGMHLIEVWELDPERRAIFGPDKIRARVRSLVGDKTFADLKLPVTAVAVDLAAKREVDIDSGSLEEAMMATMAIPAFFAPVKRGQTLLVDGALLNPMPVDVARRQGSRVVAVDVLHDSLFHPANQIFEGRGPMRYATEVTRRLGLKELLDNGYATVGLVSDRISELTLKLYPPDVLLRPVTGAIGLFAFDLSWQAFQAGEAAAKEALPQLEALARPTVRSRLRAALRRRRA
jgi:NTE family protein